MKKNIQRLFYYSQKTNKKILQKLKRTKKYLSIGVPFWTFDDAKYERYINRIKSGNGQFVFEENEWKIDEK